MESIVSQMLIMLAVVMVGFVAQKCRLMDEAFERQFSNIIINLTCPCLILSSVMGDVFPRSELIVPLLAVGCLTYAVLFVVSIIVPRLYVRTPSLRGMHSFMLMFGNVGFIGYPVAASIFGSEAIFYASLLNVANTLTVFVCGVYFILGAEETGKHRFNWRVLYCPGLVASYLSILIVVLGLDAIPREVSVPLRLVGEVTVPGALLIIGSSIAAISPRRMLGTPAVYVTSAFRLLLIPAGMYVLLHALGVDETINRINTILIGMPVASFGTMLCLRYQRDDTLMVQGTLITTILSVLTIPVLTMLVEG